MIHGLVAFPDTIGPSDSTIVVRVFAVIGEQLGFGELAEFFFLLLRESIQSEFSPFPTQAANQRGKVIIKS